MARQPDPLMTVRQYMDLLERSDVRYEYWNGEVVAMAGASIRHNLINANLLVGLGSQLRGKDCRAVASDQLVKEEGGSGYFFPDVMIFCKGAKVDRTFLEAVVEPAVVIEVLSPSTELVDRTRKFEAYSRMESVKHLVLVSQEQRLVEHFYRETRGEAWRVEHFFEDEHELVLAAVDCRLKVAEIYSGLDFAGQS